MKELILTLLTCQLITTGLCQRGNQGYRLPDTIVPRKYDLEILTNLDENDFSFEGKVWIKIHCLKPTNKIILHLKDLKILSKEVSLTQISKDNQTSKIQISEQYYAKENEFFIVRLAQRLIPGNSYVYHIPYTGELNEGLAGYYRSSYFDKTANKTKWISVTQFESTDARRAFPCFDEPDMKATFSISLGHSKEYTAISNMPMLSSKPINVKEGWVMDKFEETVPMSTYLVAFMISDFEYRESDIKESNNVTFKIWARKEAIEQVELAKSIGPKILSYFEKYFDVPYPLPKQDMAAIPDFNAGAMENWGLITYRETALLYDTETSSTSSKHRIASVISHELAHQWFGNLVTMKWWTDLWLNEGFATYVGALGVHHVYPEWKSLDSTSISELMTVLSLDALKSSHPVSVPIGHPSQIEQIFDTISYKKGSFLLRMMNLFLGEEAFRIGVSNYLKKHRFGNAEQNDLWESLTQTAQAMGTLSGNITVKTIMDSWTLQTGYPLVTVTRDYEAKTAKITQERYLSVASNNDRDKSVCWSVPLSYTTSKELRFNDTAPKDWLTCSGPLTMNLATKEDEYVIFNIQAAGLYRVNYDPQNWKLIEKALTDENEFKKIDVINRVQLISDSLGLAWVGNLDYTYALNLVSYLRLESEYLPWKVALGSLDDISQMILRTPIFGSYKKFVRALLEPMYKKLGKLSDIPEDYEGIKKHTLIVSGACYYGVADCEEQVNDLFKKWYSEQNQNSNPIPKDLRSIVYCNALKNGGENYWDFLWEEYKKSNVATEKSLILGTLGCVKDMSILRRYLEWSLDATKIRKQDSLSVFQSVAGNEVGYFVAKDFFYKKFMQIREYHDLKASRLGRYIKSIANQITSSDELNELNNFITGKNAFLKESELEIRQGIESAKSNLSWRSAHMTALSKYLTVNNY